MLNKVITIILNWALAYIVLPLASRVRDYFILKKEHKELKEIIKKIKEAKTKEEKDEAIDLMR